MTVVLPGLSLSTTDTSYNQGQTVKGELAITVADNQGGLASIEVWLQCLEVAVVRVTPSDSGRLDSNAVDAREVTLYHRSADVEVPSTLSTSTSNSLPGPGPGVVLIPGTHKFDFSISVPRGDAAGGKSENYPCTMLVSSNDMGQPFHGTTTGSEPKSKVEWFIGARITRPKKLLSRAKSAEVVHAIQVLPTLPDAAAYDKEDLQVTAQSGKIEDSSAKITLKYPYNIVCSDSINRCEIQLDVSNGKNRQSAGLASQKQDASNPGEQAITVASLGMWLDEIITTSFVHEATGRRVKNVQHLQHLIYHNDLGMSVESFNGTIGDTLQTLSLRNSYIAPTSVSRFTRRDYQLGVRLTLKSGRAKNRQTLLEVNPSVWIHRLPEEQTTRSSYMSQ